MNKEKDKKIYEKIGKKVVICIGNNIYSDTKNYRKLKKCSFDAKSIFNVFIHQPALGGAEENSILLCSDVVEKITKKEILDNLCSGIKSVRESDQLIIYYSGHGENVENELAWVTYDSDLETKSNYIKISEIDEMLSKCNAKDIFLIIDACYSGLILNESKGIGISRGSIEKLINVSNGVTVLASSKGNQASIEKSPSNNSLFSHFLRRALEGEPLAQQNYYLSVFSAYEYITKAMIEYCRNSGIEEQIAAIKCACVGIPILGDYRFRDDSKWYLDNYAKITIKKVENEYIQWLNNLNTYICRELWDNIRCLMIEFALNSFAHGNATECILIIRKTSIEFVDDGKRFNQFKGCRSDKGGASLSLEIVRTNWNKDVDMCYLYDGQNHHNFNFSITEAFDITENCTLKINQCSVNYEDEIIVPKTVCKYYFLDMEIGGPISFQKNWIEVAREKIPPESKLLLYKKDYLGKIYNNADGIEFIDV